MEEPYNTTMKLYQSASHPNLGQAKVESTECVHISKLGDVEDELFTFYTEGQVDVPTMHLARFLKKAHNDVDWDNFNMVWKEIFKDKPVRFFHIKHI